MSTRFCEPTNLAPPVNGSCHQTTTSALGPPQFRTNFVGHIYNNIDIIFLTTLLNYLNFFYDSYSVITEYATARATQRLSLGTYVTNHPTKPTPIHTRKSRPDRNLVLSQGPRANLQGKSYIKYFFYFQKTASSSISKNNVTKHISSTLLLYFYRFRKQLKWEVTLGQPTKLRLGYTEFIN